MKYKLQDLIDMEHFQNLQDRLNEIYSFPSAIIDNEGNILTATAWQEICTQFHRKNKDCERDCIESDQYIQSHLHEANPAVSYRCPRGLVDNATPIIIDGSHYGNFFTGQFFMENPDREFFRAQAQKYGFDEDAYLEALKKVPIWTQEQLNSYLFFIKGLIAVISESGLKKLKETEARKQIEDSEQRHQTILQTAMDGFWLADTQGSLLKVNAAYCRMSSYSVQELLAMRISDLEAAETEANTAAHIQKIIALGEDRFESRHHRKDGTIFDVEVSVQYQPTDGGQLVVFLRDVTERKRKEDEIQKISQLLAETQAITKVGGWEYDVATGRIKWTDEVYRIYGVGRDYDPSNVNRAISFYAPEDAAVIEKAFRQAMESGEPYDLELGFIRANGERIWVRTMGRPFMEDGKVVRISGNFMDITERKQTEEALRSSHELFSLYMHYSPIYTFIKEVTPTQSIVLQASDNYREMIGTPGCEMVGKTMEELFPPEFATKINADDWAVVSKGDVLKLDEELNGRSYTTIKFPLVQKDRTLLAGYTIDITDRKHAEEALRESENRYRELSIHDDLTKLYNSRHFYQQLKMEIDRVDRYGQPLTLLLLDLDDFKAFNDTYGHVEGDQVLLRLGQVVKRCLRQTDSAYRYGGEEFTILVPMTTSADGAVTAERIRTEFKKEIFIPASREAVHMTVSIGLAQYKPQEEMKVFVHRVDQLMYQGKRNGKDRVCAES